jgi:hypothetical protein
MQNNYKLADNFLDFWLFYGAFTPVYVPPSQCWSTPPNARVL